MMIYNKKKRFDIRKSKRNNSTSGTHIIHGDITYIQVSVTPFSDSLQVELNFISRCTTIIEKLTVLQKSKL